MMKGKILASALGAMMLCGNVLAMHFGQPVEIGSVGRPQAGRGAGGYVFKNATANNGDWYTKNHADNRSSYGKGIAVFGEDEDTLYIYYNAYNCTLNGKFGGHDIQNKLEISAFTQDIYRITSDEGITLYALYSAYGPNSDYTIIGRRTDGRFI